MNDTTQAQVQSDNHSAKKWAVTVAIITALTMLGWVFDIQTFKSIQPTWSAMKPNTALLLFLLAACLWLLEERRNGLKNSLLGIFSVTATSVGFFTICEYLFTVDLGIDHIFFSEKLNQAAQFDPPRMAPNTAFGFLSLGLSTYMLAFHKARCRKWIEALSITVFIVSFLGLVGYICDVPSLYGISDFTKMALHTAIAFILLCIGQFFLLKGEGFMKIIINGSTGGVTLRRWLPIVVIVPLLITRICLTFIHRGYLNLETWAAIAITLIIGFFTVVLFRYAKLSNEIDNDLLRVGSELREKQLEQRHSLSNAIDHFLAMAPNAETTIPKILEIACKHLGWKYAAFWSIDKSKNQLIYEAGWSPDPQKISTFANVSQKTSFLSEIGLPGRVWSSRKAHWIPDVTQDSNFPRVKYAVNANLRGALGFPVLCGEEVLGIVEIFSDQVEQPDNHLLSSCQTMGVHIGVFIHKRQMEKALKDERDFITTLFEASLDGIFAFDRELIFTAWNKAMEELTGFSSESVLSKKATEVFPHIIKTPTHDVYLSVLKGKHIQIEEQEFTYLTTKEKGFCESNWVPLLNDNKQIIGGLVVVSDITKRKRAEAERERFFSQSLDIHLIVSIDGKTKRINPAFEKLMGFSMEELEQISIENLVHPEDWEASRKAFSDLISAKSLSVFKQRCITKSGSVVWLSWTACIVHGLIYASARNRTSERNAEKRIREQQSILLQSSKMAALGEMAAGIAHEINTPLGVVALNVTRIRQSLTAQRLDDSIINKSIAIIEQTAFRIAKIVKGLKAFAKDEKNENFRPFSIKSVIDDTLTLCSERFKNHGITLIVEEISESIQIDGNPIQISQALLNLLNNAYDAVAQTHERWIKVIVNDLGDGIEITIMDSGRGIPTHIQGKVMQPFFTTKDIGQGMGLGLSISRGIVESHGGSLEYDSSAKHTCFIIKIPKRYVSLVAAAI